MSDECQDRKKQEKWTAIPLNLYPSTLASRRWNLQDRRARDVVHINVGGLWRSLEPREKQWALSARQQRIELHAILKVELLYAFIAAERNVIVNSP